MPPPSDVPVAKPAASKPVPPSSRPPPPKSSNLKYVVIGLVFLGGAAGLWATLGESPAPTPPAAAAPTAAAPEVTRVNPMAEPELVLEPEDTPPPKPESTRKPTSGSGHKASAEPPAESGWNCSGEIDVAKVRGIVDQNRAQVRACYERRLKVNNVLQGALKLQVKVNATGEVVQTSVGGSLGDREVYACVRKVAEKWRFPAPTGGKCAVVAAPFQFSPKN